MRSLSSLIGYFLVFVFLYIAIMKISHNPDLFFNYHGIGIVVGGIIIAALSSFPWTTLRDSITSVIRNMYTKSEINPKVAEDVVRWSSLYTRNPEALEAEVDQIQHSFLRNSYNLVLEGLSKETISEILNKRIDEKRLETQTQMNVMLTFSKISPALGLAATVLGLVDMLGQLKNADLAELGLGMAIALSATFYGIILSNLVFAPLSELISSGGEFEAKEEEMITDGIISMLEGKNPIVVGEIMNSYLPSHKRIQFIEKMESFTKRTEDQQREMKNAS